MVSSFQENRQYFCQYVNTRPHTINNIFNTTGIDNIIDRVRSVILHLQLGTYHNQFWGTLALGPVCLGLDNLYANSVHLTIKLFPKSQKNFSEQWSVPKFEWTIYVTWLWCWWPVAERSASTGHVHWYVCVARSMPGSTNRLYSIAYRRRRLRWNDNNYCPVAHLKVTNLGHFNSYHV